MATLLRISDPHRCQYGCARLETCLHFKGKFLTLTDALNGTPTGGDAIIAAWTHAHRFPHMEDPWYVYVAVGHLRKPLDLRQ